MDPTDAAAVAPTEYVSCLNHQHVGLIVRASSSVHNFKSIPLWPDDKYKNKDLKYG